MPHRLHDDLELPDPRRRVLEVVGHPRLDAQADLPTDSTARAPVPAGVEPGLAHEVEPPLVSMRTAAEDEGPAFLTAPTICHIVITGAAEGDPRYLV